MIPCKKCGEPLVGELYNGKPMIWSTLVGYGLTAAGHHHDDNCLTREYTCKNRHTIKLSVRRKCKIEGCIWQGKTKCSCHPDEKLDAWPEEE